MNGQKIVAYGATTNFMLAFLACARCLLQLTNAETLWLLGGLVTMLLVSALVRP